MNRVKLSSDLTAAADSGGNNKEGKSIGGRWPLLAGAGVVVVIVLVVSLVVVRPQSGVVSPAAQQPENFGTLPGAGENRNELMISGLSGRSCKEADRRPIAVMLASDPITRPVSGFARADMVWELPVLVSDVTRLMAVYQCGRPDDIGSVRSARHDYLFLAEGLDAVLAHWGGSYHALNRIAAGEFETINALTNPFGAFFRRQHLPAPYNGFTTYDNLWNALRKLGYRTKTTFEGYQFKNDAPPRERPAGGRLSVNWPGAYRVYYDYDNETNRYGRYWNGVKQVDGGGEKERVAPSSVVIMRATNRYAEGPGGYNNVGVEGEGEIEVYQNGRVIKGSWRKDRLYKNDPVHFLNESGQPIRFTRGQVWVMAVEPRVEVVWEEIQHESPAPSAAAGAPAEKR